MFEKAAKRPEGPEWSKGGESERKTEREETGPWRAPKVIIRRSLSLWRNEDSLQVLEPRSDMVQLLF